MKTLYQLAVLTIVTIVIVCGAAGCGHRQSRPERMQVAVSIGPLGDFAKNVGGDNVDVHILVQPGASPHTYQLTTDQMEMLSKASVLVLNGVNLEFWADKAIDAANNSKLVVVKTANGLPIIDSGDDHDHPGGNPHVWLNPIYAVHQVKMIRDAFIKADPEHKEQYDKNAAQYINKLMQLDKQIRQRVKTFTSKDFIAFHPAWVYFAREYGLNQVAVIEETPGREPAPSELGDIVKVCKRINAKAIFSEPQFSPKAAQVIADECGAQVLMLDPMGKAPDYDYIETMHANLDQMTKALGRK
ncbi:metal ABC transporter substrate-binding protein [bacterium]|nr:metal ABC transporter substrate-binding protein [bacterium]